MLYQLFDYQFKRLENNLVLINGPYDKYGRILEYQEHSKTYLIRGLGKYKPRF